MCIFASQRRGYVPPLRCLSRFDSVGWYQGKCNRFGANELSRKVTAIKQLLPRQNQDQVHYETQLELLTEPKDSGRCAFAKGSMVTANLSPGQNEDVSFLRPGVEIEVVCEFQRYTQEGETKEITFWTIWDYSPSIRYKNDSGLVVRRSSNRGAGSDNKPPHTCSGRLAENVTLEKVGLTPELLKQGVECVAGDFDGNGYYDFALFQPRAMGDSYAKALVLFFEEKK